MARHPDRWKPDIIDLMIVLILATIVFGALR